MKNVIPLRRPEDSANSSKPDLLEGVEPGRQSPLIEHLVKIAHQTEIQEVIQLLQDIRLHQNHPDMIRAFEENNHELAHGAKDHGKNVLELLVNDYLKHNRLGSESALEESRRYELEMHVKHVAMNTLKGYQEVVEGIREALQMAKSTDTGTSGIFVSNVVIERIQQHRRSNPRINAAFSLLENLRFKLGNSTEEKLKRLSDDESKLSESVVNSLTDKSHNNMEEALADKTNSIASELAELDLKLEALADMYIQVVCEQDYKVRRGFAKINEYRHGNPQIRANMEAVVPEENRELLMIMKGSTEVAVSVTNLWLEEDYGNIQNLDRLLDKISTDAQCYLDTEHPIESEPPLRRSSVRRTIPATPPPPSLPVPPKRRRYRETIPIEYLADVIEERSHAKQLDESKLELNKVPYVFEWEKYSTQSGQLIKLTYAMQGSVIEVADGSKLDIFMVNDGVMVRLMGNNAHLRIQKATRNCKRLQLIGKYGEAIIGGSNVELGAGVEDKLV